MIYRIMDWFVLLFAIWFALIPIIVIGVMTDKIDIHFNNDYLEEYSSCQAELERLTPNCPDCVWDVCKTSSGLAKGIIGFVWGLIVMFLIIQNKEELGKLFKKHKSIRK